jgi:hypothetical protein
VTPLQKYAMKKKLAGLAKEAKLNSALRAKLRGLNGDPDVPFDPFLMHIRPGGPKGVDRLDRFLASQKNFSHGEIARTLQHFSGKKASYELRRAAELRKNPQDPGFFNLNTPPVWQAAGEGSVERGLNIKKGRRTVDLLRRKAPGAGLMKAAGRLLSFSSVASRASGDITQGSLSRELKRLLRLDEYRMVNLASTPYKRPDAAAGVGRRLPAYKKTVGIHPPEPREGYLRRGKPSLRLVRGSQGRT